MTQNQNNQVEGKSTQLMWVVISSLSAIILLFLVWWIYGKESANSNNLPWVAYLPYLNCILNGLTAILLCIGYRFIKRGEKKLHRNTMIIAGGVSAFFLVSYLTYHHFQGDTKFLGIGPVRYLYFFVLISHILLSIVQLPLILATYFLAFKKNWIKHKAVAKITFPIWLYVSVTGVLVFFFLKIWG